MEEEIKNLTSKIETVRSSIYNYIVNTEHYIFYWIYNKEVQDFIKQYPYDYEDMIYINVLNVSHAPSIRICFKCHPDDIEYIDRYAVLSEFKDSTKTKWLEWGGNVKDRQIAEKEEELEYHKERIEAIVKELECLRNNK